MNILMVCYPTYGGSGVVATELGLYLSKKEGYTVHFVTYKQPVRLEMLSDNLHFHEVSVHNYPLFQYQPYELAISSKLLEVVKEHDIDLIHVHYAIPHAYAAYMTKQMLLEEGICVPLVTSLHGTDVTLVGKSPIYKAAVTFSIKHSDAVTAVSESLKLDTIRIFGIDPTHIQVIPNFIQFSKIDSKIAASQRKYLAQDCEKIFTHISNFRAVKRIEDVILVFNECLKKQPAKLIMVGDGPLIPMAKEKVAELGITDHVVFLGSSREIHKILSYSDIFLLPSSYESFGLSALEAMSCGVPVISSDTGGIPEVNTDGFSGFTSPVGAIKEMAENALFILKDSKTQQAFKDQAYQKALSFDADKIIPMYETLYKKTIASLKSTCAE